MTAGGLRAPRLPAAAQSAWLARDPVGFLARCHRRYGDLFGLDLLPVGRVAVLGSPALVREVVLAGDRDVFQAGAATARLLPFLGDRSPLLLDGDAHRDQRRRLLAAFAPHAVAGDRAGIEAIVRRHVAAWPRDRPFAALPRVRSLAFEVVVRHAIGLHEVDVPSLEDRLARLLSGPVRAALWSPTAARLLARARPRATLARRLAELDAVLAAGSLRPQARADDVLAALAGDDERAGVESREVLDVLRALVLVGHETTGTAGAWLLRLLAEHLGAAGEVRAALRSGDGALVRSCVEEALRLRPPVVDAVREAASDLRIAGCDVPAGTIVMAAPTLVHARPDVYDRPRALDIARFVDRRPDPAAWIPFGGGPRRCLGAALALTTLEAVVTAVLGAGDLRPGGPPERARLSGTTLVPSAGARIVLNPWR